MTCVGSAELRLTLFGSKLEEAMVEAIEQMVKNRALGTVLGQCVNRLIRAGQGTLMVKWNSNLPRTLI